MVDENISPEFRLRNIEETRNCFAEEIKQKELMCKKHEEVYSILNYIEHFIILATAVTGCISISAFASLFGIPVGITSSAIAGIKKYKSIIKKAKNKLEK